MRADVQKIFRLTPHTKQVMMFSATLSEEIRNVCKKFMHNVLSHYHTSTFSTIFRGIPTTPMGGVLHWQEEESQLR